LQLHWERYELGTVRAVGGLLAAAFREDSFPEDLPVVLLLSGNVGQTLGNYATGWGKIKVNLIVVDEVRTKGAHFASLGRWHEGIVPVGFHRMVY
jgi:hypothetical protein